MHIMLHSHIDNVPFILRIESIGEVHAYGGPPWEDGTLICLADNKGSELRAKESFSEVKALLNPISSGNQS